MATNTSYVPTSPILAKVLEENQRLVSPGRDENGPQEDEKSRDHSLEMDSPPRQSKEKTENVQSTGSPVRNGSFDLKEFIAKLQTSPNKSGSPKKVSSKISDSNLIHSNMEKGLEHCKNPEEKNMINQDEKEAVADGSCEADVQLKVLEPSSGKDGDTSNDDMAWKADLHGFYQSSKNSNFTTLQFNDIDISEEGEEKSDVGGFPKGDSDADGDRQKDDEGSNGRYKRDISGFDLLHLADNERKTKGIPMVVIQAPTPSDVSRASSSVGSSRPETPETEANRDVTTTKRQASSNEHSLSKDAVIENGQSSDSEADDDTARSRSSSNNEAYFSNVTGKEYGLSSQSETEDQIDGIFGEEGKYFHSGDSKEQLQLLNNDISESVFETYETNLDDKTMQLMDSDFQERGRSPDPDLQDDITALSDTSEDLGETFQSTDMANNSLMTSWSELEIVQAISQNDYSDTVKFSKNVDSSPKITWGSTTTAHDNFASKMSDMETGNDILLTSIGSATELRAILERSDPIGADVSAGGMILEKHRSFDSDNSFSLSEEDVAVSATESGGEHTQGEYTLQKYTLDEPPEKEHTGAISDWTTQPDTETLERVEERTGNKFKFRKVNPEEAAEKIINEFMASFDADDVLTENVTDTNTTPLTPLQTTESPSAQKSVNDRYRRPQFNSIPDTRLGDLDRENSPDELANPAVLTNETPSAQKSVNDRYRRPQFDSIPDTRFGYLDRENSPDELTNPPLLTSETATERSINSRYKGPHSYKIPGNGSGSLDRDNSPDELANSGVPIDETSTKKSINNRYRGPLSYRISDKRPDNVDWENRADELSSVLEDLEAISLLKSVESERGRLETVRGMRIKMEETFGGLPIEKIPACVYDKWQELIGDIVGEQDMHFQGLEEEQENLIRRMRLEIENLAKEILGLKKCATDTESYKLENELLRKQLNGLEGYVSSLEGRIKCKTTENVNLVEELEDARTEMTSKKAEFKNQATASEQEITNFKSEIDFMKEEKLKLMNEIKMKDIEYKKLVNEKEKVKDELQSDVGKINANSISLRNRIMELQQENETLKTANEADQTIIRHLEIKGKNAHDTMEELRKEKSKVLKDLEESRIKEADMRKEQEVINSKKNDLIKQNDLLMEKIRQLGSEKRSVSQELNSRMNTDLENVGAMLQELKNLESSLNSVRKEKSLVEDKYNTLKFENERLHKMLDIKKRKHDLNKLNRHSHQRNTDLLIDLGPEMGSRHGADSPQSMNSIGQSSVSDALDSYRSSNVSRSSDFIDATTLSTPREFKAPESSVSPLKMTGPQNSLTQRKVTESQTPVMHREPQSLRANWETQPPRESVPSRNTNTPSTIRHNIPPLYDSESESIDSYAPLPKTSLGYSGPGYSGFSNGTPMPDVMVVKIESPTRKHANGTSQTPVKRSAAPDQRQNQQTVGNGKSNSYSAEDTRSWLRSMETKLEQTDQILKSMKKSNQVQV